MGGGGSPGELARRYHAAVIESREEAREGRSASRSGRLLVLLDDDGRELAERWRLVRLIELLADRPAPPDPLGLFPSYSSLRDELLDAMAGEDGEVLEEAFLRLYCHLHGYEAPYTPDERARVDATGGYWCHAGGTAPILKAPSWLRDDSRSVDFGAGNGLQLLLMQVLRPHRRSVQVEISSRMIECGRALQSWLGVPEDAVEWVQADVRDVSPAAFDFVYLYRPLHPEGVGLDFYRAFAAELIRCTHEIVVFSVADCLGPHLTRDFRVVHADGHLTCYRAVACRDRGRTCGSGVGRA